ncbi:MAG: tyrosine-type recombinase/integrase [Pseudobdellovibrionaceae bacterium]
MAISKKIKNGNLSYEVFVKDRDSSGKQVGLRRMGISSEREAKRIEFELKNSLQCHRDKVSWANWVEHFLKRYKSEYRNSTFMNYKFNIEKWMMPVWKNRFIDEITPSDVHSLIFEHITGVSSYTKRGLLKIIKRIFNLAIEEGVLTRNPAVGIKVRVADPNQAVLNKNEIEIFLREAKSVEHRFYPHWALALLTGMRSGELHSLRWTDIDFVSGYINISKAWTRYNGEGSTTTAKNRVCPISKECRKFLQELKQKSGDSEKVLSNLWEWDQGHQGQVTRDFCKGIGITSITFHDLRATFITQMLINGVPLAKVMSIVGHSSLKTTQGYLRLCGKDVEGATESLGVIIPENTGFEGKILELRR